MGRQYGGLLKGQLQECYAKFVNVLAEKGVDINCSAITEMCQGNFDNDPERFKPTIDGVIETSGLTIFQLAVLDNLVPQLMNKPAISCRILDAE